MSVARVVQFGCCIGLLAKLQSKGARGSDAAIKASDAFIGEPLTNAETGLIASLSKSSRGKMLSASAWRQSVSPEAHAMAIANLYTFFPIVLRRQMRPSSRPGDAGRIENIHHFDAPMRVGDDVLRVKILVKKTVASDQNNPIYNVLAVDVEKPASVRGSRLYRRVAIPHRSPAWMKDSRVRSPLSTVMAYRRSSMRTASRGWLITAPRARCTAVICDGGTVRFGGADWQETKGQEGVCRQLD